MGDHAVDRVDQIVHIAHALLAQVGNTVNQRRNDQEKHACNDGKEEQVGQNH